MTEAQAQKEAHNKVETPSEQGANFLTLADIEQAQKNLEGQVIKTSFRKAPRLSKLLGCNISIKFENEQVSGSFKERGALNKLMSLTEEEKEAGVIAASAGNHAQGVAYHAGRLGITSVIVMPAQPLWQRSRPHGLLVPMLSLWGIHLMNVMMQCVRFKRNVD